VRQSVKAISQPFYLVFVTTPKGIDRPATNAALDTDFEAANTAALNGQPLPPSLDGSAASNEAALSRKKKQSMRAHLRFRLGLNRRLIDAAILNRDVHALRTLEGETRGIKQQGFLDDAARFTDLIKRWRKQRC
jgi:hypothetical protein